MILFIYIICICIFYIYHGFIKLIFIWGEVEAQANFSLREPAHLISLENPWGMTGSPMTCYVEEGNPGRLVCIKQ